VLVVDDEEVVRHAIRICLGGRGFDVDVASGWSCVRARCASFCPDAIILDHQLTDGEGVELLAELRTFAPNIPVVIVTGHATVDLAVRALRGGAVHFLTKPVDLSSLEDALHAALGGSERAVSGTRRRVGAIDPFLGKSAAIEALREVAERYRESDRPILLLGETGSGKSILARWFHESGPRSASAFVDLNCAGLARELLESELFGHERGAFTGAQASKTGLLELADGGTVFLDEIGDMDPGIQPKLLKVLEEKRFRRLGQVRDRSVDIRLISATHQDLAAAVRENKFRGDLYYRVSALPLILPPLRERREDIPAIAEDLLHRLCSDSRRAPAGLTRAAFRKLAEQRWPGNIRELKNVLERTLTMTLGDEIDDVDLRFDSLLPVMERPRELTGSELTYRQHEAHILARALEAEGWRVVAAAKRLGMPRSSLYYRIKVLGLRDLPVRRASSVPPKAS
jgi:DNA-binding NtrC family response regulator